MVAQHSLGVITRHGTAPAIIERRRYPRVPVRNGHLTIDGAAYPLVDWSLNGFCASGYRGGLQAGAQIRFALRAWTARGMIEAELVGQVVRREEDQIAGTWHIESMTERDEVLMRFFLGYSDLTFS
jgi:hypothetical protein